SSRDDEDCHLCIRAYVLAAKRGRRQNRAAPFGTPIKTYRSHPDRFRVGEERILVERARAGDRAAFEALYEGLADEVYRKAITPLVRNPALAEELLADTFVRALEKIGDFEWRGRGILPWLMRIGKNKCFDHLRRARRVAPWPEGYEQRMPDETEASDAEWVVATRDTSRVLEGRVAACMALLIPRYRKVLELRMVQQRSREEAAELLEVSVGTLDVLLCRARKAFCRKYNQQYGSSAAGANSERL
ncbi:MAG: RNA polymerase sigma factor, partial [Nannocystaceae bacterium]